MDSSKSCLMTSGHPVTGRQSCVYCTSSEMANWQFWGVVNHRSGSDARLQFEPCQPFGQNPKRTIGQKVIGASCPHHHCVRESDDCWGSNTTQRHCVALLSEFARKLWLLELI
jgi:hypothetical protein